MRVKTKKEEYKIAKNLSLIVPSKHEGIISDRFKPSIETINSIENVVKVKESGDSVKKEFANVRNLTFGVTHECNLRCKYCGFSGKYNYNRMHDKKSMDISTFKKAVDLVFNLVNQPERTKRDGLVIAFYGGEALLEIEKVIEVHDYAVEVNRNNSNPVVVSFLLTTNGVLLSDEIIETLLDKNFRIDVSLDGPKEEHDKFRVKTDQKGTFDDIIPKVETISRKQKNKLRFLLTIHPDHDIKKIEEFFLSRTDLFHQHNVLITYVALKNLKEQYKDKWQDAFVRQRQQIYAELDKDNWFYKKLFTAWMESYLSNSTDNLSQTYKYTATCIPGLDKIYVDVDGTIHMCERITSSYPIGDVNNGLDYNSIARLINQWNGYVLKNRCWECDVWWLCNFCYVSQNKSNSYSFGKEDCMKLADSLKSSLEKFLAIKEKEDEIKNRNCYDSVDSYLMAL